MNKKRKFKFKILYYHKEDIERVMKQAKEQADYYIKHIKWD